MPWHNKVLRNIEIFDFVIFRDGSYYSLFVCLLEKKKSFRVMDGLLKSEHFQPSHTNSVHSETFPRKIMHRFRLFLGRKRCIVFGEFS